MENIHYYVCPTVDKPIVYCIRGKDGDLLIDTGRKISVHSLDRWIGRNGFNIRYLLLTHGHFDHCWNAKFFKEKYKTKIILHRDDLTLYRGERKIPLVASSRHRLDAAGVANHLLQTVRNPVTDIDYLIDDTDTDFLTGLGFDAQIVPLPGHTLGSVGVRTGDILYCGDACSVVKGEYHTTFFGEDKAKIYETEDRLLAMDLKIIAPGHGRLLYLDGKAD